MTPENLSKYLIFFDDRDMRPELFDTEEAALKRLEALKDNWNCYLFRRVTE